MRRKEFLSAFLGALGAEAIEWKEETESLISGIVIYVTNDPEEIQEFCWHKREDEVPSNYVINLAKLIKDNNLLSIDKIIITRNELRLLYNNSYNLNFQKEEFSKLLESLEEIEVPMVDDGKETDVYFIHE